MADKTVRGRFVWHELAAPDPEAAQSFYTKVLGWKAHAWDKDPSYTLFEANSGPIGGTSAEAGQSQWISYIGTEDIEATVRQAQDLGGLVTKEISSIPDGGRYALLEDPQGAAFGLYESTSGDEPEKAPKRGEVSWHELATDDYQAAFDFYAALFGWEEAGQHDMGAPAGVYFMFGRNGVPIGGIFNRMPEMPPSSWTPYVRVRDVQKILPKAKSAGATLLTGPMEVPGGDWIAQFVDPQGAIFAVHTVVADVKGAPAGEAANEGTVTPEEAGAQRQEEALAAEEAVPVKSATKRPAKSTAKPAKKKAAEKATRPAAKSGAKSKPTKKPAQKAGKKKAGKKKASAKKAGTRKVSRPVAKKGAKKGAKKSKSAARTTKRPSRKSAKVKRPATRRPAKKAAARARRGK